ncbi:unnamed protein product [Parnassius apollo]|uniref:(apollo) hypothetical protein n=1 Tax=Parnassius apollo TaxID=110799 RepID=A0A8S3W3U0_PARAO|nr:unnamed protein product [Parnassius apollo]
MSQILNKVRDADPNNSDAIKDVLGSFFQNVLNHTSDNCNQWLRTLEYILTRYPKYCSTYKATSETYLSHFLNWNNYYDVIEAAKCVHSLQQVQWPQNRTATAKSAWRDQMELLCEAAHSLIDALFSDSVDMYKKSNKKNLAQSNSSSSLTAALKQISLTGSTSSTNKHELLQTRLRNVFVFIQAMIVEIYPVAKPIRPQTILDVILRSLSVTSGKKLQSDDVAVVKIQALRTLDALIACLGANLIPFSPLVFRIVMQTFRWSTDMSNDGSRDVRRSAYNSLSNWLTTLHSHRFTAGSSSWEDELTGHIVNDTTPPKKTVQLTMSGQSMKNLSKKARRKLQNTMLKESTIAAHMPGEKNKLTVQQETDNEVAMSALECAEVFLTVCGVFLKPTTHKVFQDHFVRECYNSNTYSDAYILSLLRVLEASRKTTPSTVPPPTQYCLHLYSVLSNNHCREISKFCSQALLDIRLHLHCSPPSLNFALEIRPDKEKIIDNQKRISERNRAALEKLLGPDRMPVQINEEVITIPDEPLSKKPRLDDSSDKISLSSESVCSVEMSDEVTEVRGRRDGEAPNDLEQEKEISNEAEPEEVDSNESESEEVDSNEAEPEEVDSNEAEPEEVDCSKNADDKEVTIIKELVIEEVDGNLGQIEKTDPIISEVTKKSEKEESEKETIYEAETQIPLSTTHDEIDEEERSLSMEVTYDYPNTGTEKVTVLEKMDDENLPSTNDTDDVQITCGQAVVTSQEIDSENKPKENEGKVPDVEIKVNGIDAKDTILNGDVNEQETTVPVNNSDKLSKPDDVSIADMMADFVDEVNEQSS